MPGTALESAIEALSDPNVSTADALRRLLVISRRIGASELSAWLRGELNGYSATDDMPAHRAEGHLPFRLTFDGPMHSESTMTLSATDLPAELTNGVDGRAFREPVAELEALSKGSETPAIGLPMRWIALYRHLAEQGKAPYIEMMVLNRAHLVVPATHLKGLLDRVKSTALDLALSLEDVSPEAGSTGGPTVTNNSQLAQQVTLHLTQIYAGDNATIATGHSAVALRLEVGDIAGVLKAARSLLDEDAVSALAEALETDDNQPAGATKSFLQKVRAGGYGLAGGVATNAAYDGLLSLLQQVFPGMS